MPYENAAEMLGSQQEMLSEPDVNPFFVYEEDSEKDGYDDNEEMDICIDLD